MKTERIIFGVIAALCIGLYAYAESCSTVGTTQNKYTASGCSYTTQTRTCCSNGSWSDWEKSCPATPTCGTNECWDGSSCVAKGETSRNCSGNVTNATSGSQTRTATCTSGSGWSYGSWTGICTCKSNFTWSNNRCVKGGAPSGWSWHYSSMNPITCQGASSASCGTCNQSKGGTECVVTVGAGLDNISHCYFDCLGM